MLKLFTINKTLKQVLDTFIPAKNYTKKEVDNYIKKNWKSLVDDYLEDMEYGLKNYKGLGFKTPREYIDDITGRKLEWVITSGDGEVAYTNITVLYNIRTVNNNNFIQI